MSELPSISVIVCTYSDRRWELFRACVTEVCAQAAESDAQVVVVVDHNEELRARCAARFPDVTVVSNRESRGLSGARNTGIAESSGETVVFIDDDAVPHPGWLATMRAAFTDPELLGAGGEVRPVWPEGARPPWLPPEFDWAIGCDYAGMAALGAEMRNPIGANMALRREAVLHAGGFRAVLGRVGGTPAGCEETDLAIRLKTIAPQGAIRRIPGAAVDHHVAADRCRGRYLIRRCYAEGGSKAVLMRLEGAGSALSAEADHAMIAIPRAIGRELTAALHGDRTAPHRILWTVLGLTAATLGWLRGMLRPRPRTGTNGVPEIGRSCSAAVAFAAEQPRPHAIPQDWPAARIGVSVVLCTLGRAATLPAAVRSVLDAQTWPAAEVLVVDNDPASGAVGRALAEFDDPRLRVVAETTRGVSYARNAGLATASGPVVAFIDDDVIAESDWVRRIAEVFEADPDGEIACVTGLVVPADLGLATHRWFEASSGFGRGDTVMVWEREGRGELLTRLRAHEPLAVAGRRGPAYPVAGSEFGSGNNMALRREWLVRAGGFDTVLGTGGPARGGEDLDMFRRTILDGGAIVYQPAATVRHHHRDTPAQLRRQMYDYGVGMCASVVRYASTDTAALLRVLRVLPGGLRLLVDPRSAKNSGKTPDHPRALTYIELAGYLTGPVHLVRSHLTRARRERIG